MYHYHQVYRPVQQHPHIQYPYPPQMPVYYAPRQFPPVQPEVFMESSKKMLPLLRSAETLVVQVSKSESFSRKLMDAAQKSNVDEVKKLVQSTGVQVTPKIDFNPDGLNLNFDAKTGDVDCCHLGVTLRWRNL